MQDGVMGNEQATRKFNLSLPQGLMDEFYRVTGADKRGRKQQALSAAVLLFLEAADGTAEAYIRRVGAAGATNDGYKRLLDEVKAKRKSLGNSRTRPPLIVQREGVARQVE